MADSSRKMQYLPIRCGSVGARVRFGGFVFYVYFVRWVLNVDWGNGGGWRVGAKNEGRRPRLSRKWRILLARGNIYRPAGIRIDPGTLWWFRILFLFCTLGVACRLGS